MHTIQFISPDPLDHVCRALDAIRKMGFELASLHAEGAAQGGFRICIALDAHDQLTVGTLLERVSSYIGVHDLAYEADCADGSRGTNSSAPDARHKV